MSLAGLMKQVTKASQFVSEKVGGAEGTVIDEGIQELGRKMDLINESVENISGRTKEYLQPNPNTRAKLAIQSSYQTVTKKPTEATKYPQVEFNLGEAFTKYGANLETPTPYPAALKELGTAFNTMSETKDAMEESVKQKFLLPLHEDQEKDLKDIAYHRKKLEGRRLDFDYKKRKSDKVSAEELKTAEEKFLTSHEICLTSMTNFVESEGEHVAHLYDFSTAIMEYHERCAAIMRKVNSTLAEKLQQAQALPRSERKPLTQLESNLNRSLESFDVLDESGNSTPLGAQAPSAQASVAAAGGERCRALFDFAPQNPGDLGFFEGDVIELVSRDDANWWKGSCNGAVGIFPVTYVEMI